MEQYKAYKLDNFKSIPQIAAISPDIIEAIEVVGRVLPFKTNSYVVDNLIDWTRVPADPIFTLTFPRREMLSIENYDRIKSLLDGGAPQAEVAEAVQEIRMTLNPNPASQEHNVPMLGDVKLKGVQHKYNETVLFFPSQGQTCHAYCTFCFRWPQFSGIKELKFHMKESHLLYDYLAEHTEVTDLLITGGDPMTMTTKILKTYIEPLFSERFNHIRTVRIGTKSLSYWPYRYTTDGDSDDLIELFSRVTESGRALTIQAQFNHPVELTTTAVKDAVVAIRSTGAQIRTQSPLLKHINDNPDLWVEMWRAQVDMGMIPYYMFIARDTGSKLFFELPLERCHEIFRSAYSRVSGVCRTVRGPSMSASPGKIEVLGITEVAGQKAFALRFLQGRDTDWVYRPFFAKYDAKATWFDDLKPLDGEAKFFFEE